MEKRGEPGPLWPLGNKPRSVWPVLCDAHRGTVSASTAAWMSLPRAPGLTRPWGQPGRGSSWALLGLTGELPPFSGPKVLPPRSRGLCCVTPQQACGGPGLDGREQSMMVCWWQAQPQALGEGGPVSREGSLRPAGAQGRQHRCQQTEPAQRRTRAEREPSGTGGQDQEEHLSQFSSFVSRLLVRRVWAAQKKGQREQRSGRQRESGQRVKGEEGSRAWQG